MERRAHRGLWLAGYLVLVAGPACSSSQGPGPWKPGQPLTVNVTGYFAPGAVLRDQYAGKTATVDPSGAVTVVPDASGVVLLEQDGAAATPFTWANATVYFAMTDRFFNGNPANDGSYGRKPDGASDIGTWHGGDLAGLVQKLDYIQGLGATAIWISPPVEQVHGWVAGGTGDFKHYGYAGYWALDFTQIDQNFGTPADLQALVDGAHARGIRVLVDVVMNHPGYATGDDLVRYLPEVFLDATGAAFQAWTPGPGQTWLDWNDFVNYGSSGWANWWANPLFKDGSYYTWIRAGFPGFQPGGTDDLTRQLDYLPDFRTEETAVAGVPVLFDRKVAAGDTTGVADVAGGTVRDYLVKWHTDWVRQMGIDGFRCDTAKNVELASWSALKGAALTALADWKAANPSKKLDDAPFWMAGEVFGHGVAKDYYYTVGGFDSLINFSFQGPLAVFLGGGGSLASRADDLDALYAGIAGPVSTDPTFDVLTYVSSHDTALFYGAVHYDPAQQRQAGTALLLAPGGVQIFYGDESGRQLGPAGSDPMQGTRSDMNWGSTDGSILAHWTTLANFRKRHASIGAGSHARIGSPAGTYAFGRKLDQVSPAVHDAVVVILTPAG